MTVGEGFGRRVAGVGFAVRDGGARRGKVGRWRGEGAGARRRSVGGSRVEGACMSLKASDVGLLVEREAVGRGTSARRSAAAVGGALCSRTDKAAKLADLLLFDDVFALEGGDADVET